jgi:hypothetical protein
MPLHFTIQYTPQYTAADHPLLCLTHTTPFLTHHTSPIPHHITHTHSFNTLHYTTTLLHTYQEKYWTGFCTRLE